MLKLAYQELPRKTYTTAANAVRAFTKTCAEIGITDMRYLIASDTDKDGRWVFFPVALPSESQVQNGINLAHNGFLAVRI